MSAPDNAPVAIVMAKLEYLRAKIETLDKQCEVEKRRADMADSRLESARQELKEAALLIEHLRAKWDAIPWELLSKCCEILGWEHTEDIAIELAEWLAANAPEVQR